MGLRSLADFAFGSTTPTALYPATLLIFTAIDSAEINRGQQARAQAFSDSDGAPVDHMPAEKAEQVRRLP